VIDRVESTQLLNLGGFSALLLLVLAELPFLRRNGYISESVVMARFGALSILAGSWMIRSPEKHDRVVTNEEDYSESKVRW